MKHKSALCIIAIAVLAASLSIATPNQTPILTHLILGGEQDGDGMLFYPRQAEEGPDGNLYVLDASDSFIKVYSPGGDYLRSIGGSGEGPGEFQRVDGATFGFTYDDKLFFTEFIRGHRWISILELNGDLIRVLSPKLDVEYGVAGAVSLVDGGYLLHLVYSSVPKKTHDYFIYYIPQSLVHMDGQGAIVSEIVRTDTAQLISYTPTGGTTNLPFTPLFEWVVRDDNMVLWSDGMTPKLQVFDLAGQLVQEQETRFPKSEAVTKDDLHQWVQKRRDRTMSRNPAWWHNFGRVIEDYDASLYGKPVLNRISTTPDGLLLVELPGRTHWLLDAQGNLVHSVDTHVGRVRLTKHYLLYFSYDEEGNTLVNAIRRPASEIEALSLLSTIVESE